MGFFHPPLLKRAMHPNGNANRIISIMAMLVKVMFRTVCRTRLTVENVRNRKMPFNHIPTCHP